MAPPAEERLATTPSKSDNHFGRVHNRKQLFELERWFEQQSRKALFDASRSFSGFFTGFGRRA